MGLGDMLRGRRTVRNTSNPDEVQAFAYGELLESTTSRDYDPSAGILRQEAQGQRELATADVLPSKVDAESRTALEAAGVVFGEAVPGDPLFQYATLPTGWKKQATEHSMWSVLLDAQGRKRATVGYKAAFYDRWAQLDATRRYRAGLDYSEAAYANQKQGIYVGIVEDGDLAVGGRVIFSITESDAPDADRYAPGGARERAEKAAQAWLDEHYPDWQSLTAYWDDNAAGAATEATR